MTTLPQSIANGSAREAEQRDPPAVVHVLDHLGQRLRRSRHLEADVEPLAHAEARLHVADPLARHVDRGIRPHLHRELEAGGLTSLATMKRAPTWRATAIDMRPMGPQPVTSTSSPTTENARAVCTALPNGSKIAPTSGSTSANGAPTRSRRGSRRTRRTRHPGAGRRPRADAHLAAPGAAVAAHAADDVALARHVVADRDVVHELAHLDDLAVELVARDQRGRISDAPSRPTARCAGRCRRCRCAAPGSSRRRGPVFGLGRSTNSNPAPGADLYRAFIGGVPSSYGRRGVGPAPASCTEGHGARRGDPLIVVMAMGADGTRHPPPRSVTRLRNRHSS